MAEQASGGIGQRGQQQTMRGIAESCGLLACPDECADEFELPVRWYAAPAGFRAEFDTWRGMLRRCYLPSCDARGAYHFRGVRVFREWAQPDGILRFIEDMGAIPSRLHSLDREDVNGHYTPANCRWATREQQNANKRNNHYVQLAGERVTITEAARRVRISEMTLRRILRDGVTADSLLNRATGS